MIKKACDQDLTNCWDTLKGLFIKVAPQVAIHDACGTWHGLWTIKSIHSIQKSTRISQELGNELASYSADGRIFNLSYSRIKTEKNWVDKWKSLEKKKEKMFRLRSWLLLHLKQYKKLLLKNLCHQKAKKPTFCWSLWWSDEVARYVPTYWPTINKQTTILVIIFWNFTMF